MSNKHKISDSKSNRDDDTLAKKLKQDDEASSFTFDLPSEIVLEIFKCMNMREICQMARVCKKWRRVAYDEILWYHLDLSDSCIDVRRLWKLFRHRCFENVKSISICGNSNNPYANKTKQSVTSPLMQKLNSTCKCLTSIEIRFANLESITVNDLPYTLESLSLRRCEIPVGWFKDIRFKNLKSLNLSDSANVRSNHIEDLMSNPNMRSLESLVLKNCYRINDKAIEILIEKNIDGLVHLNISGTVCTNSSIHFICTNAKKSFSKLNFLDIKNCKNLLNTDFNYIITSFKDNESFTLNH